MTTEATGQDLRYPIGQFDKTSIDPTHRTQNIQTIADLAADLAHAVNGLDDGQLDTPYRPDGWTIRQTVHHLADSHMNAMIRFKLTLTEEAPPTIRPYFEDRWAELGDSRLGVDVSLKIVSGVHERWVALLNSMTDEQFALEFEHPESGTWSLGSALALYAWHSHHHTAHITSLREREGW